MNDSDLDLQAILKTFLGHPTAPNVTIRMWHSAAFRSEITDEEASTWLQLQLMMVARLAPADRQRLGELNVKIIAKQKIGA